MRDQRHICALLIICFHNREVHEKCEQSWTNLPQCLSGTVDLTMDSFRFVKEIEKWEDLLLGNTEADGSKKYSDFQGM